MDDVRRWPRTTRLYGLARGWAGPAWTWLTVVGRGLGPDRATTRAAIARRLRLRDRDAGHVGLMIGSAAAPTVAARLSVVDPSTGSVVAAAVRRWELSFRRHHPVEVMLGAGGSLLAGAEIETIRPGTVPIAAMQRCHHAIVRELAAGPARGEWSGYLGMAHGVAGMLFAAEAGAAAFGFELPSGLRAAVIDFVMDRRTRGPRRIANWQCLLRDRVPRFVNAWCHGAAGIALAAMAGRTLSRDAAYDRLIECALPSAYAMRGGAPDFCCGIVGQGHVFVEAYRLLGDRRWLARARASHASLRQWQPPNATLQRGRLGLDYLALRVANPDQLPMPGLGPLSA